MHARTGSFTLDPSTLDPVIAQFESEQIPRYRDTDRYKGFVLAVNRDSGGRS